MNNLRELYQEVILEHGRHPRNFKPLANANRSAEGFNPLCGDQLTIFLHMSAAQKIEELTFQGCGCAISMASASLMTETLMGKNVSEATEIFDRFHLAVTQDISQEIAHPEKLGKLLVLVGVREFPARVKCATLAWHTLKNALEDSQNIASTE